MVAGGAALGTAAMSGEAATTAPVASRAAEDEHYPDATPAERTSAEDAGTVGASAAEDEATTARPPTATEDASTSPTSPTSPSKKRLTGLFSKLKRRSKATPEGGFIGGATLRNSESNSGSKPESMDSSVVPNHIPNFSGGSGRRHSDVSSLSGESSRGRPMERTLTQESKASKVSSEYEEARDTFNESLAPPPSFPTNVSAKASGSPVRDSRFHEVL